MNPALVHILCFGNPWHGDDAFGLHVLRRLRDERRRLPSHVRTFDAGTAGLNAIPLFEGCNKAVLVDAVRTGANIGQLHRISLTGYVPVTDQQGMHGSGVENLLGALPVAFPNNTMPEVVLIGAEIGPIAPFTTVLSPAIGAAITPAVKLVETEYASHEIASAALRRKAWMGDTDICCNATAFPAVLQFVLQSPIWLTRSLFDPMRTHRGHLRS